MAIEIQVEYQIHNNITWIIHTGYVLRISLLEYIAVIR